MSKLLYIEYMYIYLYIRFTLIHKNFDALDTHSVRDNEGPPKTTVTRKLGRDRIINYRISGSCSQPKTGYPTKPRCLV